ncbi:hypothetical protein ACHAWO_002745 [Cyclotella atomus]|jgi:hypothetical protein|uniref:Uncharacterized protein n=1 Tax=Cyclotella atomus TaxID=382360 RepID=A0ABD3QL79_9STRA
MNEDTQQAEQNLSDGGVDANDGSCERYELDEVFFPVTVVNKTTALKADVCNAGQSEEAFVDEDAILRCFDLSVSSHMQQNPVPPRYEPITSDSSEVTKMR